MDDKIIDVDYVNATKQNSEEMELDKHIYYNAVQVAKIIGETDSTVRHWAREFNDLLNIGGQGKVKKYSKQDIENLKFIQKLLRVDGYSIKQAYDYCFAKGFDGEKGIIDANNHLAVKVLINALSDDVAIKINEMQKTIIKNQEKYIQSLKVIQEEREKQILSEVAITVDEVVSEKLNEFKAEYEKQRQEEIEVRQREIEQREILLLKMEENKKRYEEENRGFFKKLFKR